MKVNPSQSQPIWSDPNASVSKPKALQAEKIDAIAESGASSLSADSYSSEDAVKMQQTVKELMQQSAVRTEVVEKYDADAPVKAFDEETLRRFVSALSQEP